MVYDDTFVLGLLQNVGFPLVVTLWFMVRTEKVIDRNTQAYIDIMERLDRVKK